MNDISLHSIANETLQKFRTISALIIILQSIEKKMKEIYDGDRRANHSTALGHIRSAISYETFVRDHLTDPNSMAMITEEALNKLLALPKMSPANAIALLMDKQYAVLPEHGQGIQEDGRMKNPWATGNTTEDGYTSQYCDVESRLAIVKTADIAALKVMIIWPDTQKSVITAAKRRLRKLIV